MMLGEALRLFRVYNDLKITQLSTEINLSTSYISEIENGKKTPNFSVIEKYSAYFDVPASSILAFAEALQQNRDGVKSRIAKALFSFLSRVENGAD